MGTLIFPATQQYHGLSPYQNSGTWVGLAFDNNEIIYALWSGNLGSDSALFWARFDTINEWGLVRAIPGSQSDNASLAWMPTGSGGIVVAAWSVQDTIHYSMFRPGSGVWVGPSGDGWDFLPNVGTNKGPSIAYVNSPQYPQIYMVWKGSGDDGVWWNRFDGRNVGVPRDRFPVMKSRYPLLAQFAFFHNRPLNPFFLDNAYPRSYSGILGHWQPRL
jgi:hypothetical protein